MAEPTLVDKKYEAEFEFPLLKLIRERAEEEDISYLEAANEVVPEYARALKLRDMKYIEALLAKEQEHLDEVKRNPVPKRGK